MDPSWQAAVGLPKDCPGEGEHYHGKEPSFWTEQVTAIFDSGLCRPISRDLVETGVTLYLLFCGDCLRRAYHDDYHTFSIPLGSYWTVLKNPPREDGPLSSLNSNVAATTFESMDTVNFVQFRRVNLGIPLEDMLAQGFLKDLYTSGTACFLCDELSDIDMVVAVKSDQVYKPLLVSIKVRERVSNFDRRRMQEECKEIHAAALSMIVLIGLDETVPSYEEEEVRVDNGPPNAVVVPLDDPFGVSNLVLRKPSRMSRAAMYESQWMFQS
jgi:hypothetical protein